MEAYLPHIPYIQNKSFTPGAYRKFEDRILGKLERMGLHGLRDNIVTRDVWIPHDIERFYGSDRRAIYGTASDKNKNGGFKHKKQSELYDNLYFVGGTVKPGGMPMVTLSGQQVSQRLWSGICLKNEAGRIEFFKDEKFLESRVTSAFKGFLLIRSLFWKGIFYTSIY